MQLCQKFGISGGFEHSNGPPPLGTPLSVRYTKYKPLLMFIVLVLYEPCVLYFDAAFGLDSVIAVGAR